MHDEILNHLCLCHRGKARAISSNKLEATFSLNGADLRQNAIDAMLSASDALLDKAV